MYIKTYEDYKRWEGYWKLIKGIKFWYSSNTKSKILDDILKECEGEIDFNRAFRKIKKYLKRKKWH